MRATLETSTEALGRPAVNVGRQSGTGRRHMASPCFGRIVCNMKLS
jgi:hypothetical protein